MKLKFVRKHEEAVVPTKAHHSDVGLDLTAIREHKIFDNGVVLYDTGIAITPPDGYYVEIVPRSSISKTGWMLANSVGTIDPSYTGNLYIALVRVVEDAPPLPLPFCKCQIVLRKIEDVEMEEVDFLYKTVRGDGGFGSTDQ
jgi:dUTP pyrophosphatase